MNKDEYVIINKTAIQKRIEELKKRQEDFLSNHPNDISNYDSLQKEIDILEEIPSQSTPLIPEIDKAYEAGILDKKLSLTFDNPKGRYLSSLKLDI